MELGQNTASSPGVSRGASLYPGRWKLEDLLQSFSPRVETRNRADTVCLEILDNIQKM